MDVDYNASQNYQLNVGILEARHLSLVNVDTKVTVSIGNQKKSITAKTKRTDAPFYNEYCFFPFHLPLSVLLDKVLTINVYGTHLFWRKKLIGNCNVELSIVWSQPNHQFYHKWAVLYNPEDPTGAVKGFLKCDICVLSKGSSTKPIDPDLGETIEDHLLVPADEINDRRRANFVFTIFRADGFTENHPSQPFIRVKFFELAAKTSIVKKNPEWNEEIIFLEIIPSLSQNVYLELCDNSLPESKRTLGHAYLDLRELSHEGENGFLPTFGPSFLYFYQNYQKFDSQEKCCSQYNSLTYVCRVLIALRTVIIDVDQEIPVKFKKTIKPNPIAPLQESRYFKYKEFVLFAAVYDILIFDKKFSDKNLAVKITLGPRNNVNEANGEKRTVKILNTENTTGNFLIKSKQNFSYVLFDGMIPCIYVWGEWPDSLRRLNRSNIIQNVIDKLIKSLTEVEQELLYQKKIEAAAKLRKIFSELISDCHEILTHTKTIFPEDTNLHRERLRVHHENIKEIIKKSELILKKKILIPEEELKKIQISLTTLKRFARDPENSFPNAEIWLLKHKKAISQCSLKTGNISYSRDAKGFQCGEKQTILLQGKDGSAVAKLEMFMWFGLMSDFEDFLNLIPAGFNVKNFSDIYKIPKMLEYVEKSKFQCRVHIFQARITLTTNVTGLPDPFVRVIVLGNYLSTQVKKSMIDPIWDETLIFPELVLYGSSNEIKKHSQVVTVEVLDREKATKSELIGRCFITPLVKLNSEAYEPPHFPPKLKWEKILDENKETGRILIAVEFLEISETDPNLQKPEPNKTVLSIPNDIRPHFISHRLEILFWGVRSLKKEKFSLLASKLIVTIECGKHKISSRILKRKNINFSEPLRFIELEIPEEQEYAPPITIKLHQSGDLKKSYVGSAFIPSIFLYYCPVMTHEEIKNKELEFSAMHWEAEKIKIETKPKRKIMDKKILKYKFLMLREKFLIFFKKFTKKRVEKVEEGKSIEDENFDWWLKYYASKEDPSNTLIPIITIYEEELEAQPEFSGFTDFLSTFNITTAKKKKVRFVEEESTVARLKTALKIYKWPLEGHLITISGENPEKGILSGRPKNESVKILIRVYVIRGINLMPKDVFGKSDPYLILYLGDKKINDRVSYIANQVNPTFGKCFEFKGQFPEDFLLKIQVMDRDVGSQDDLIGETCVDIENRYYSKHYASCGISKRYDKTGYNAWRDMLLPSEILRVITKQSNCNEPIYLEKSVKIDSFELATKISDKEFNKKEHQALTVLHRWPEIPLRGFHLVPEHIETRSLYHPSVPGIEQGKIEMWIDIFPENYRYMPAIVDITPRKPSNLELRAIVWNVEDVILDDTSFIFRQKMSDIYIKGWINGLEEDVQKTDVHYRSLNGEGNFNWRFIFPFTYILPEHKMVIKRKEAFHLEAEEEKLPCKLELEVWDNDALVDDFLGALSLELWSMPRGAKLSSTCKLHLQDSAPKINLFKIKRTRGWWPFRRLEDKDSSDPKYALTGKIDLELEILTEKEAKESPAGKARSEPKPLPMPHRPETSFLWFTSPLKAIRFIIFKQSMKFLSYLLVVLIIAMIIWFILSGIYAAPGYFVKKIMGARR